MSNDEPRPTPPRPRLPLAGLTVLVPRAKEQAGTLSELLRQRGAEPLEVPTNEIRPVGSTAELDRAVRLLASGFYDWVVLTSVNGVAALRGRVEAAGAALRHPDRGDAGQPQHGRRSWLGVVAINVAFGRIQRRRR